MRQKPMFKIIFRKIMENLPSKWRSSVIAKRKSSDQAAKSSFWSSKMRHTWKDVENNQNFSMSVYHICIIYDRL